MAFAIPVVAVLGKGLAAAAGAGIGGTALGMAWNLRDNIHHTTTTITQVSSLILCILGLIQHQKTDKHIKRIKHANKQEQQS